VAPHWIWPAAVLQAVLLVATAFPPFTPGLGVPTWHHNASLALAVAVLVVFWRPLQDRRVAGQGVLVTSVLAIASAFLLLYLKQDLKDWGLKDWAKWWHVAWSWFSIVFLVAHTAANKAGLLRSTRRMLHGWRRIPNVGFYAAALVAVALTWSTWGAQAIVDANYILWTHWTWLAFAAPAYGAWAVATVRRRLQFTPRWHPGAVRDFCSAHLLPITILANVTGLPILYFATKDTSMKYVAKWWHTWPSIAMAILLFAHTLQFLPGVTRHWRQLESSRNSSKT
jgi:hypothetical protein